MAEKQRYFIELSYDGSNYHGWQVQPNALTVQQLLDEALSTVLRQSIETTGCGRTDTGVHATQFYAHFDLKSIVNSELSMDNPVKNIHHSPLTIDSRGLNAVLPKDIAIKRIIPVHHDAHARFDATQRSYEYHIHFEKDPFKVNRSWELRDKPDIALMNKAAAIMMEYTDFSCFSKSNTQTFTNNCKITKAEWVEQDGGLVFHISADRFLRNMVRAIVGTLIAIGRKEMGPAAIKQIIESKNRSKAGTSVPACGLYLTEVKYPYL
ncbi:MAG: tRNA pseudouridine(38-40) synthase TruA [Bacteroidetes bacterium]|nr:tRNA pseudouridine(38-40) synthase TruA [Bacteroidota bacterium]